MNEGWTSSIAQFLFNLICVEPRNSSRVFRSIGRDAFRNERAIGIFDRDGGAAHELAFNAHHAYRQEARAFAERGCSAIIDIDRPFGCQMAAQAKSRGLFQVTWRARSKLLSRRLAAPSQDSRGGLR